MEAPAAPLFRVFLAATRSACGCFARCHIFAGLAAWRNEWPDTPPQEVGAFPASGQPVKPARKQFRQARIPADGDQSFSQTVNSPRWNGRRCWAATEVSSSLLPPVLRHGVTADGKGCDTPAPIQRRAATAFLHANSAPRIGLTPACFAASTNSTAPCKLPVSVSATAGSPCRFASSTIAAGESVESRNE